MSPLLARSTLVAVVLTSLTLLGIVLFGACTTEDGLSQDEYLKLVEGWLERDLSIRERAGLAAGETSNRAFPMLQTESEGLRAEIAEVEPPEECRRLHDAFLACEEHFANAMSFLGKGEDFKAIDELALANMAKQELKAELQRLGVELERGRFKKSLGT